MDKTVYDITLTPFSAATLAIAIALLKKFIVFLCMYVCVFYLTIFYKGTKSNEKTIPESAHY